jgi:toxin secretion/phage lysis holin
MNRGHNIDDWEVFRDCAVKFASNFVDIKIWAVTFVVAPLFTFTEKYLFADWEFLKFLTVFMALDLITGVAKALKKKEAVTSYGLRRTVVKAMQYGVFLIVVHGLDSFQVKGESVDIFGWIVTGAYSFLMAVEGKSILENIVAIDDRFDIASFIERIMKQFKKDA